MGTHKDPQTAHDGPKKKISRWRPPKWAQDCLGGPRTDPRRTQDGPKNAERDRYDVYEYYEDYDDFDDENNFSDVHPRSERNSNSSNRRRYILL